MSGYVYFIESEGTGFVKIGWAKYGPLVRLAQLQTGSPNLLYVRAYFEGSLEDEKRMHRAFRDLRGHGEWFANTLKLADFLDQLAPLQDGIVPEAKLSSIEAVAAALHDQVMQSEGWYPDYPVSWRVYDDSGDWTPWRDLLWQHFGPWDET